MTSAQIANQTQLERKRILRALTVVRTAMLESAPEGLRPMASARRSSPHVAHDSEAGHRRPARSRPPVLGLRLVGDDVWAEVVADDDADSIVRSLRERRNGRGLHEATPPGCAAVVYRSRLYQLASSTDGTAATPVGKLEDFWAYLHHRLRSKGGIRRERLRLYLAEYAWRYNNRNLTAREQLGQLLKLIARRRASVRTATHPTQPKHDSDQMIR